MFRCLDQGFPRNAQVNALDSRPLDLAGKLHHGWKGNIGLTQEGEDGDIGFLYGDLGPEDHHGEELKEGVELRRGDVDKKGIVGPHDIHVVEDVALDVQVEGAGAKARWSRVKLLRKQVIKELGGVLAADTDNAALGSVNDYGAAIGGALLAQWIAIVPGHPLGIEYGRVLVLRGTGALQKRRRITHNYRW